jgi:hypothetical protein
MYYSAIYVSYEVQRTVYSMYNYNKILYIKLYIIYLNLTNTHNISVFLRILDNLSAIRYYYTLN